MKYISEFRNQSAAAKLADGISMETQGGRPYRLMEFCGGHTHAIFRYGIQDLLPENVTFIHGPGCPVCVLPIGRLDNAINLAQEEGVILCTYGDMLRVPASGRRSLLKAKASGADVRMIYSTRDALQIARDNPQREVVFFAIGFETTTPPTAVAIKQAAAEHLTNFSVFCNHVLTPSAMRAILESPEPVRIDGFLGPSHVSTIIGSRPYREFADRYRKPVVISGFEPLDVLQSVYMLIRQLNERRCEVENEYTRAVEFAGNRKAQQLVKEVFCLRPQFEWRGLGLLPDSALQINRDYQDFDAEQRFSVSPIQAQENKGCECPAILRGVKQPLDCKLFDNGCSPENPLGSCMVSSEGACAAYWSYGRVRGQKKQRKTQHAVA